MCDIVNGRASLINGFFKVNVYFLKMFVIGISTDTRGDMKEKREGKIETERRKRELERKAHKDRKGE